MSANVHDVTALLLERLGGLDTWRLQKLLYYAQAWHLAYHDAPLYDDVVQAWAKGPVVPSVYQYHAGKYGVWSWPRGDPGSLDESAVSVVTWVVAQYGEFTGAELSKFTHAEIPWTSTRAGLDDVVHSSRVISHELMRDCYRRQLMAPESAAAAAVGSARLEGFEFDEADVERIRAVAAGSRSADDVVAEIVAEYRRSCRGT